MAGGEVQARPRWRWSGGDGVRSRDLPMRAAHATARGLEECQSRSGRLGHSLYI